MTLMYPVKVDKLVHAIEVGLDWNDETGEFTNEEVLKLNDVLETIELMSYQGHETIYLDEEFVKLTFNQHFQ